MKKLTILIICLLLFSACTSPGSTGSEPGQTTPPSQTSEPVEQPGQTETTSEPPGPIEQPVRPGNDKEEPLPSVKLVEQGIGTDLLQVLIDNQVVEPFGPFKSIRALMYIVPIELMEQGNFYEISYILEDFHDKPAYYQIVKSYFLQDDLDLVDYDTFHARVAPAEELFQQLTGHDVTETVRVVRENADKEEKYVGYSDSVLFGIDRRDLEIDRVIISGKLGSNSFPKLGGYNGEALELMHRFEEAPEKPLDEAAQYLNTAAGAFDPAQNQAYITLVYVGDGVVVMYDVNSHDLASNNFSVKAELALTKLGEDSQDYLDRAARMVDDFLARVPSLDEAFLSELKQAVVDYLPQGWDPSKDEEETPRFENDDVTIYLMQTRTAARIVLEYDVKGD